MLPNKIKKNKNRFRAYPTHQAVQTTGSTAAFRKAPLATQQRVRDNARTLSPYWARPTTLPTTCEQLGSLKVPPLVVSGEKTRANFRYGNETLLGCLPNNTATVVIPGAPHMWYEANPDAGARAILAFISQH